MKRKRGERNRDRVFLPSWFQLYFHLQMEMHFKVGDGIRKTSPSRLQGSPDGLTWAMPKASPGRSHLNVGAKRGPHAWALRDTG